MLAFEILMIKEKNQKKNDTRKDKPLASRDEMSFYEFICLLNEKENLAQQSGYVCDNQNDVDSKPLKKSRKSAG
jgi:hypothetical protein